MATTSRSLSHKLLSLDGSPHLQSYHRNLGPHREAPNTPNNDASWTHVRTHGVALAGAQVKKQSGLPRLHELQNHVWPTTEPTQSQPLAIQKTATQTDFMLYPPILCNALEHCNTVSPNSNSSGTVYHVMEDNRSSYMDNSSSIVGTYHNRREANECAVEHFVDRGFWAAGRGKEPEVKVLDGGMISCAVQTSGSLGGLCTVYVKRASVLGRWT